MKSTKLKPRLILLSALLLSVATSIGESATMKNRRGKKPTKQEQKDINVCDIEQADSPFYCYCNDNKLASAEEANCLIFNRFELSDPIWAHFNSQMYIRKLNFVVKNDGTITYIPTAVLRQLKTLNTVSFQHAKFDAIESQAFSSLPTVATINLAKNSINMLKWHAFESLANLTILNLDENYISELSRDIFYDVPILQKLFLSHNNISILHDKAFKHLPSLQELDLNSNKIVNLKADSFNGLYQLQRLDLRNNLIAEIKENTFGELRELQELELDQNQIEFIANKAFNGLYHLKKLRLSENKLSTLEPNSLIGAPMIGVIDLRDNALRTMTFENIKPIITNFYNNSSFIYLGGNNLICDCKLSWIWGLRNETRNLKLREDLEELMCFLDASFEPKFDSGEDINRALEIVRNTGFHMKQFEDSQYFGDNNYEDYSDDAEDSRRVGQQMKMDGKMGYIRQLFRLRLEDLPCPTSREEVMASEQPSGRSSHGSSLFSFVSGGAAQVTSRQLAHIILGVALAARFVCT
ncbi:connectin isoform X2 [Phymastichus coffea]|nr:connectin isoform X2 [Phymastichus coffea]XP_058797535.1 connectin isoform X2 [Phymastichus coffea]